MKVRYDKDVDILVIDQGKKGDMIDYAEQLNSIIAHFTKEGKPVLLEILDATEFLTTTIKAITSPEKRVTKVKV
jgi:uncharacterized protein YuzE